MRSLGRLLMKSSSTELAMPKRVSSSFIPPMSSDIMDQDKSSTSMISTPLAWVSVRSLAKRGPASATMHNPTVSSRKKISNRPAAARATPPAARAMSALEKRSAENLPTRPRRKAYTGSSASSANAQG